MADENANHAGEAPKLVWFRKDLRLTDNPALHAAASSGAPVVCVYVYDDASEGLRPLGGASNWWLDKSLRALKKDIESEGGTLLLRRGEAAAEIEALVRDTGASGVYWNRRYEAGARAVDEKIKSALKAEGVEAKSFNGSVLMEPWALETSSGGHYKVFTPFWKALRSAYDCPSSLGRVTSLARSEAASDDLDDWDLHPKKPDWSQGLADEWSPGEAGAAARLEAFLDGPVGDYDDDRNRPDKYVGTSRLSPHLRFGEIGPAQVWRAVRSRMEERGVSSDSAWVFLSELAWRDFSYVLLYHNADLATENYNSDFDHMPWRDADADYTAWTKGQTGYPIVDAGMRQLWTTGWMHNRVRMIVASFLTKHLLIHWRRGEDWFWDTLVDADPASNAASWQWTAGSGADAAPYFRVFNPITQGEKFDPSGDYVRKWVPELADLSTKHLFAPWDASASYLDEAGVALGETYPKPLIAHKDGRERALDAYEKLKEKRNAA